MSEKLQNLVDLVEGSCHSYADRLVFAAKKDGTWQWQKYRDFGKLVDAFRGGLAALGVGPGDKVAIISDNRIEWAVACYATYGLAAAYVPMYQAQHPEEWRFIIADCAAKVVICATNGIVDTIRQIQADTPALQHVVGLDLPETDAHSYAALINVGRRRPVPSRAPAPTELAGLIYTSGTTGMPKGVMLSHGNIASNINAIHEMFTFAADDRSLAFLPWAHSFGQTCELHALLSMGCQIVINDDVANLVQNMDEVKPTVLYAVPSVFNRLYAGVNEQISAKAGIIQSLFRAGIDNAKRKNRGERIGLLGTAILALADRLIFSTVRQRFGGRLKYAISGSASLSQVVADFIDALGITVYEGYGLTETSPIVTANYPGHRKMGSVGKAIPGVTIRIDTQVLDDPQQGEIIVAGPNVMQGYHNRPEETRAVLMHDGSLRTGDMGHLDDEGYLYVTGRIKEQYKLENGKYVVPSPLEEQLKLSPYIANVLLYGANKPYNVAIIVPNVDALRAWAAERGMALDDVATDAGVRALLRDEVETRSRHFRSYEKIRAFIVVTEDFTTANGMMTPTLKIKRRAVLERYGGKLDALY